MFACICVCEIAPIAVFSNISVCVYVFLQKYNSKFNGCLSMGGFCVRVYIYVCTFEYVFVCVCVCVCVCILPRAGKLCGHRVVAVWGPCGPALDLLNQLSRENGKYF